MVVSLLGDGGSPFLWTNLLLLAFCGLIWCYLRALNRVFNMHSIVFQLHATKPE